MYQLEPGKFRNAGANRSESLAPAFRSQKRLLGNDRPMVSADSMPTASLALFRVRQDHRYYRLGNDRTDHQRDDSVSIETSRPFRHSPSLRASFYTLFEIRQIDSREESFHAESFRTFQIGTSRRGRLRTAQVLQIQSRLFRKRIESGNGVKHSV